MMPQPPAADPSLRAAMHGVRGLLLDLDGVLTLKGAAIPGAIEAMAALDAAGFPYLLVTNTSLVSRPRLARWTTRLGFSVRPERFLTALSGTADLARRLYPDRPLFAICSEDARHELDGLRVLRPEEVDADPGAVAAVILGDSPEMLTRENLDRAFRCCRLGADLVAMHRNPWWHTPAGPTLDAGAYLVGLELALRRRARIGGKPSPVFYRAAIARMAAEAAARGEPALRRADLVMVGDDVDSDVGAAQRLGLRGVLVRTGKHGDGELAAAAARTRGRVVPAGVAPSLAEVVAAVLPAVP